MIGQYHRVHPIMPPLGADCANVPWTDIMMLMNSTDIFCSIQPEDTTYMEAAKRPRLGSLGLQT